MSAAVEEATARLNAGVFAVAKRLGDAAADVGTEDTTEALFASIVAVTKLADGLAKEPMEVRLAMLERFMVGQIVSDAFKAQQDAAKEERQKVARWRVADRPHGDGSER